MLSEKQGVLVRRIHNGVAHISGCRYSTGKKTPGGAGTHTEHTGARGQTDHTDEPHNHPPKPKDTNPHENRDSTGTYRYR